jgi:hypothetical protein
MHNKKRVMPIAPRAVIGARFTENAAEDGGLSLYNAQ